MNLYREGYRSVQGIVGPLLMVSGVRARSVQKVHLRICGASWSHSAVGTLNGQAQTQ